MAPEQKKHDLVFILQRSFAFLIFSVIKTITNKKICSYHVLYSFLKLKVALHYQFLSLNRPDKLTF